MSSSISTPKICPQRAKVRVIGKIRNFNESENCGRDLKPWITVRKPQDDDLSVNKVTVSFSDQSSIASKKDASFELNDCYQQDEDIDDLFTREIKPLISEVLKGGDASIIAYGARGSGKTALVQGMTDKAGLSTMAMDEILTKARDFGKLVCLSIYEVFQEHAYDLLDAKRSEIQVLEDARGRIKLKGLSQVSVESLSQFEEYRSRSLSAKTVQKIPVEVPKRSHKVVVVYLSSINEPSSINRGGKMNFVDLAGYEDTRRKSCEGNNLLESVKINKSLHSIMNVIYALNTNDCRVPFRESKLTRMLQESLGGSNPILLLACMNPLFCQDTIHTVSVASRSCQNNSCVSTDSAKKATGSTRVQALPSQKIVRPLGTPKAVKKQVDCNVQLSTKKANILSSGRKLKEAKEIICSQAESPKRDDGSAVMIDNVQESTTVTILQSKEDAGNNSLIKSQLDLVSDEACQHNSTVEQHEGENPLFCQETIHTVSVASQSCQNNDLVQTDSTKKVNSSTKVQAHKIVRPFGTPKVVKKQVDCNVQLSTKKANIMSSGRKIKESREIICSQSKVSCVKQPASKVKSPKGDGSAKMIEKLQESTTTVTILQTEEVFQHNSVVEHEGEVHPQNSNVEHEGEVCSQNSTVEDEGEVIRKDSANNNLDVTPGVANEKSALDHGTCNMDLLTLGGGSPPLSERLRELSTNLKLFCSTTPSRQKLLQETVPIGHTEIPEPKTPDTENRNMNAKICSPWDAFSKGSSRMKDSFVQQSLNFLNTASKEDLKKLKGIGEKRATYILELREESPAPFKNLDDLTEIGLSAKQITGVMKNVAGELFS